MFSYIREVIKNALEDSEFREDLSPIWLVGSVVVGVVAAITITTAITKGYKPDLHDDLLE